MQITKEITVILDPVKDKEFVELFQYEDDWERIYGVPDGICFKKVKNLYFSKGRNNERHSV